MIWLYAEQKKYDSDINKLIQVFMVELLIPSTLHILQHILQNLRQVHMYCYVQFNINSLLCALDKGNEKAKTFMQERFIKVERQEKPQKSFYDPLPKSNVKTMADMQKTVIVKVGRKTLRN